MKILLTIFSVHVLLGIAAIAQIVNALAAIFHK